MPVRSAFSITNEPELDLRHANGRKLARKRPPLENELQVNVVRHLRTELRPGWQFTSTLAGEKFRTSPATLHERGLNRGWPDLILGSPSGRLHGLELKRKGEGLSDEQQTFFAEALRCGWSVAWTDDLDEALAILRDWGALP